MARKPVNRISTKEDDYDPLINLFSYPSHTLLLGATMSGKSNLLKQILITHLFGNPTFKSGIVDAIAANRDWTFLPADCVFDG